MRTKSFCREKLRVSPLDKQTFDRVRVITRPELGEVSERFIVDTPATARTKHHRQIRVLRFNTFQYIIQTANIVDVQVRLFLLQIRRVDISDRAIAIPFEESDTGIFSHQIIHYSKYEVLHFRIAQVKYQLITEVIFIPIGKMDDPVFMFLIKLTLRIHHFRFYPQTELDTLLCSFFDQTPDTVGQFICRFIPVSQALMIAAARIFIGKPAVVQQEHIHSEPCGIANQSYQFLLIKIEISRFPVI